MQTLSNTTPLTKSDTTCTIPLLGFAAYSGTGKTTLLEQLIPKLTALGIRIGMLKHAHHDFDIDQAGKDSYRLRKAGATQMLISSRNRYALMTETPDAETEFEQLLTQFEETKLDIILIEGFKKIAFPKIELHRETLTKPWLHTEDDNIIAIASDLELHPSQHPTQRASQLPHLNINDIDSIANFIIELINTQKNKAVTAQSKQPQTLSCDALTPAFFSVEQGRAKILSQVLALATNESCHIDQAYGRILSDNICSPINVPQYTNSAMDGYAIRSDDLDNLNNLDNDNKSYQVIAEVMAGYAYTGRVEKGQCVKIMTGAPVPSDVDTVVMREQASISEQIINNTKTDTVTFTGAIRARQNVRNAGEDIAIGQTVFEAGTKIESTEMGMIASLGMNTCPVVRKIKVAIFSTGDEVQAPGTPLQANAIFDSNRYVLIGLLNKLGCEVLDLGIIEDNEDKMVAALASAGQQADMIITSGGVSVGDADYIKLALERLGKIDFWRINMRPGRPLAFGHINKKPFFGLPGNPVAVMVSFINFVEPALRKLQGEINWAPLKVNAIATEDLRSRLGRTEFARGVYQKNEDGFLTVATTGKQGSGILRSMSEANCLIEIPPSVETVKTTENVTIIPLQGRV